MAVREQLAARPHCLLQLEFFETVTSQNLFCGELKQCPTHLHFHIWETFIQAGMAAFGMCVFGFLFISYKG